MLLAPRRKLRNTQRVQSRLINQPGISRPPSRHMSRGNSSSIPNQSNPNRNLAHRAPPKIIQTSKGKSYKNRRRKPTAATSQSAHAPDSQATAVARLEGAAIICAVTDETVNALRAALAVSPENVPLRAHLAETLLATARYSEAAEVCRQGLSLKPAEAALELLLADAFQRDGI